MGQAPEYLELAKKLDANHLNLPAAEWEAMSESERWATNQRFLDEAIARGDSFRLATEASEANPLRSFARELSSCRNRAFN